MKNLLDNFLGYKSSPGSQGAAYMRSKYQPKNVKYPFIQFQLFVTSFGSGPATKEHWKRFSNYDEKVFIFLFKTDLHLLGHNYINAMKSGLHLSSHNYIHIIIIGW